MGPVIATVRPVPGESDMTGVYPPGPVQAVLAGRAAAASGRREARAHRGATGGGPGRAEMDHAQLVGEVRPELRAAGFEQLGAHTEGGRCVSRWRQSPGAELGEHRDELDRVLGEAVRRAPPGSGRRRG